MPSSHLDLERRVEQNTNDIVAIYELLAQIDQRLGQHDIRFLAIDNRLDGIDGRLDTLSGQMAEVLDILRTGR